MIILHDPQCANYGSPLRPEQPTRVIQSVAHLHAAHPAWEWRIPAIATEEMLLTVHTPALLKRLQVPPDFDEDTPYIKGIYDHARRAVGAALCAMNLALVQHEKHSPSCVRQDTTPRPVSDGLLLPEPDRARGRRRSRPRRTTSRGLGFRRSSWNGTEAILDGREDSFLFGHQFPGYPGTGTRNSSNCRNYPSRPAHAPRRSPRRARPFVGRNPGLQTRPRAGVGWIRRLCARPDRAMTLEIEDFAELGRGCTSGFSRRRRARRRV